MVEAQSFSNWLEGSLLLFTTFLHHCRRLSSFRAIASVRTSMAQSLISSCIWNKMPLSPYQPWSYHREQAHFERERNQEYSIHNYATGPKIDHIWGVRWLQSQPTAYLIWASSLVPINLIYTWRYLFIKQHEVHTILLSTLWNTRWVVLFWLSHPMDQLDGAYLR